MASDADPLHGFLRSLAPLCGVEFLIWDPLRGPSFSTRPEALDVASREVLRDLAIRVAESVTVQEVRAADGRCFGGIALRETAFPLHCLMAIQSPAAGGPEATGRDPVRLMGSTLREFMEKLREFVETDASIRKEAQSLTEELDRSYEDLYLFSRIATQIKSLMFSPSMLRDLIGEILETMRVELAFARLTDKPDYSILTRTTSECRQVPDLEAFMSALVATVPDHAPRLEEGCYVVNNSADIPAFHALAPAPYRLLAVRIQHKEVFHGWLMLASFNMKEIFRRSEHRLLRSMSEQLALVISNSDLYRDLETFVVNMVKSLVQAIEAKDAYTRGHSERVNQYSMLLARELALDPQALNDIQWASLLHDVGKIGIPEAVLNKPGRLTGEEYALIQKHPVKGTDILRPIAQLRQSLPAILHHHERYDGAGYPAGLRGEGIPLSARIIAVADTYDALTSDRAYRPAQSKEDALKVLDAAAGTQLDRRLVQVMQELLRRPPPAPAAEPTARASI